MTMSRGPRAPGSRISLILGLLALLVILPPLVARWAAGRTPAKIVVADLRSISQADAVELIGQLRAQRPGSSALIVMLPEAATGFGPCSGDAAQALFCSEVTAFPAVALVSDDRPDAAVARLYGPGPAAVPHGSRVFTAERSLGSGSGLVPAVLTSLVLALGAAVLLVRPGWTGGLARALSPGRRLSEPGRSGRPDRQGPLERSGEPAGTMRPDRRAQPDPPGPPPAAGPPDRRVPASASAPVRPPPEILPEPPPDTDTSRPERAPAAGDHVVTRSHFGPDGGYVVAGGLVLWAELDSPADPPRPGERLTVLGTGPASGSLVVSVRGINRSGHHAEEMR